MKVSGYGWGRNRDKQTVYVERSLTRDHVGDAEYLTDQNQLQLSSFDYLDFSTRTPTMSNGETSDGRLVTGGVRIMAPATVPSGGNYELTVQLSAQEILLLAVEATKRWPVEYLLQEIGRVRADNLEKRRGE